MNKIDFKERIKFSDNDIIVLKYIDKELLDKSVEFLKNYKKVQWIGLDESNQIKSADGTISYNYQPLPIYPKELKKLIFLCNANIEYNICSFEPYIIPSLMSPYEIVSFINKTWQIDAVFDGCFGIGVKDDIYLSMLLHLKELLKLYSECK